MIMNRIKEIITCRHIRIFCILVLVWLCTLCLFLAGCSKQSGVKNSSESSEIEAASDQELSQADASELSTTEERTDLPSDTVEAAEIDRESSANQTDVSEDQAADDSVKAEESDVQNDSAAAKTSASNGKTASSKKTDKTEQKTATSTEKKSKTISWNKHWQYAKHSKIHSSDVTLYYSQAKNRKNIVVAINAGHGTKGGEDVKTDCHPDGSAKVTGGSTSSGATKAYAVAEGMSFDDGTSEAEATLSLAKLVKKQLLKKGYDVLMIREDSDTQLDNIARTIYANQNADCHIALHYDGTDSDKGVFYCSVPSDKTYRKMEPVKSHWKEHNALGEALIQGMKSKDIKVFSDGKMEIDLTQTAYSTIPSVDLEVGDQASSHSKKTQKKLAKAIVAGLDKYYEVSAE